MNFSVLAEAFEKMENTTKRLELTESRFCFVQPHLSYQKSYTYRKSV